MVTALLFDLSLGWSASALPHTHLKKGEPIDYKSGSPAMHESKQTKGSFFLLTGLVVSEYLFSILAMSSSLISLISPVSFNHRVCAFACSDASQFLLIVTRFLSVLFFPNRPVGTCQKCAND